MLILGTGYSTDLLLIFSFLLLLLLTFYLTSYKFLRKILFLFDPELIHKISFRFLKIIFLLLAAGFDKDAIIYHFGITF